MSSLIPLWCLLVFVGVALSRAQAQIVGGTPSAPGKWPFFAGLFIRNVRAVDSPHCGAVVWDKDTLLTAAHCVSSGDLLDPEHPELFYVYMGHNSWPEPRDMQYVFNVREIIMHPYFRKEEKYYFDIALIFLDRSIDFNGINRKVQCVNGPVPFDYLDTSRCVAMGWGFDDANKEPKNLMEVTLPILDNEICDKHSDNFHRYHHLCAGVVRKTNPICIYAGDSGGPFVCPQKANPDKYSLVGIASYGKKPLKCKPGYFTKVEFFKNWIDSVHDQDKTCNDGALAEVSHWWPNFMKSWFGQLFSYNDLLRE